MRSKGNWESGRKEATRTQVTTTQGRVPLTVHGSPSTAEAQPPPTQRTGIRAKDEDLTAKVPVRYCPPPEQVLSETPRAWEASLDRRDAPPPSCSWENPPGPQAGCLRGTWGEPFVWPLPQPPPQWPGRTLVTLACLTSGGTWGPDSCFRIVVRVR